jgi:hypothetical protein
MKIKHITKLFNSCLPHFRSFYLEDKRFCDLISTKGRPDFWKPELSTIKELSINPEVPTIVVTKPEEEEQKTVNR